MLAPAYDVDNIHFTFTRDPLLLQQYFKVRDEVYEEYFRLPSASLIHDDYDDNLGTDFLIVSDGKEVIGGARIIFRLPKSSFLLPFESDDFLLIRVLPDYDLDSKMYCEVDRTVLREPYRRGHVGREIVRQVAYYSKNKGADYLFTVDPPVQARNNKRHCSALGIDFRICTDIDVPDTPAFNGVKMFLTITDLKCPVPEAPWF